MPKCKHVKTAGKNKGQECGTYTSYNFCSKHEHLHQQEVEQFKKEKAKKEIERRRQETLDQQDLFQRLITLEESSGLINANTLMKRIMEEDTFDQEDKKRDETLEKAVTKMIKLAMNSFVLLRPTSVPDSWNFSKSQMRGFSHDEISAEMQRRGFRTGLGIRGGIMIKIPNELCMYYMKKKYPYL